MVLLQGSTARAIIGRDALHGLIHHLPARKVNRGGQKKFAWRGPILAEMAHY
jgi:hypothetical protein